MPKKLSLLFNNLENKQNYKMLERYFFTHKVLPCLP